MLLCLKLFHKCLQIIKGSSPVLRSDVSLEMVVTLGNGTEVVAATKLYDNGNGGDYKTI